MPSRGPIDDRAENNRHTRTIGPVGQDGTRDPGNRNDDFVDEDPTTSVAPRARKRDPIQRTLTVGAVGKIIPIVYGKQQVGATVPYAFARGSDLYIQYFIAEGPIEEISELGFGDSTQTNFDTLGLVEGTDYNVYLGTHDQNIDPILMGSQAPGVWKWRFPRIAYVALKYNVNRTGFQNVDPKSFRCVVKGRLVNDHRIDGTMDYADRAYSDNSALVLADFYREPLFGVGADETEIEYDSWDEAADDCDQSIETFTGDTPTTAPTVAEVAGTGFIDVGRYQWGYTRVDANGVESTISDESSDIFITPPDTKRVLISDLTNGSGTVTKKRIYRRQYVGGVYGPWKRIGEISGGTNTTIDQFPTSTLGGGPPDETVIRQFRTCLQIREPEAISSTVDLMRGTFTAAVVYNNGMHQVYVDKLRTATGFAYTAADIVGIPKIVGRDASEAPLQVVLHFVNQSLGYKPDEVSYPPLGVTTVAERTDRVIDHQSYESIPSYDQAFRVAKWLYNRGQSGFTISFTTDQKGALPLPMSRIQVAHARMGLASTNVLVSGITLATHDTWTIQGELEITPDTDYHADPGTDPPTVDPPPPSDPPAPADNYYLNVNIGIAHVGPLPE